MAVVNALRAGTVAACTMVAVDAPRRWNVMLTLGVMVAAWILQIRCARQLIATKHSDMACADAAELRQNE